MVITRPGGGNRPASTSRTEPSNTSNTTAAPTTTAPVITTAHAPSRYMEPLIATPRTHSVAHSPPRTRPLADAVFARRASPTLESVFGKRVPADFTPTSASRKTLHGMTSFFVPASDAVAASSSGGARTESTTIASSRTASDSKESIVTEVTGRRNQRDPDRETSLHNEQTTTTKPKSTTSAKARNNRIANARLKLLKIQKEIAAVELELMEESENDDEIAISGPENTSMISDWVKNTTRVLDIANESQREERETIPSVLPTEEQRTELPTEDRPAPRPAPAAVPAVLIKIEEELPAANEERGPTNSKFVDGPGLNSFNVPRPNNGYELPVLNRTNMKNSDFGDNSASANNSAYAKNIGNVNNSALANNSASANNSALANNSAMVNNSARVNNSAIVNQIVGQPGGPTKPENTCWEEPRWYDFSTEQPAGEPDLLKLSRFLDREASRCGPYAGPEIVPRSETTNRTSFKDRSYAARVEEKKGKVCLICNRENHPTTICNRFTKAEVPDRWDIAKKHRLCFRCLRLKTVNHTCKTRRCEIDGCQYWHHGLLHFKKEETQQKREAVASTWTPKNIQTFLKIVPVTVFGPSGKIDTYALLDDGSTVTLVEESIAKAIGTKGKKEPLSIEAIGNSEVRQTQSQRIQLTITGTEEHTIEARTIAELKLSPQLMKREDIENCSHLQDITKEILHYRATPKIIIGQDNWHLLVTYGMRKGETHQPVASLTPLGWVLHGSRVGAQRNSINRVNYANSFETNGRGLKDFFAMESLTITPNKPQSDPAVKTLQLLEQNTKTQNNV